jgi:hypothetical protein
MDCAWGLEGLDLCAWEREGEGEEAACRWGEGWWWGVLKMGGLGWEGTGEGVTQADKVVFF